MPQPGLTYVITGGLHGFTVVESLTRCATSASRTIKARGGYEIESSGHVQSGCLSTVHEGTCLGC